jgi:hypothetical protein
MNHAKEMLTFVRLRIVLFFLFLGAGHDAMGQLPFQSSQWDESYSTQPEILPAQITFDQYSSGAYSSAVSEAWYNAIVNHQPAEPRSYVDVGGPGILGIGPAAGFGSNQSGLFTDFGDNGGSGSISIYTSSFSTPAIAFTGLNFDVYSGVLPGGLHGPTSFNVKVLSNASLVWQSETVELLPGASNAIHWDLSNPDGNEANGDGIAVRGPYPSLGDWRILGNAPYQTGNLEIQIIASGANSSLTGLGLDNIQLTFASTVVPEPSSCLLLVVGLFLMGGRSRRGKK